MRGSLRALTWMRKTAARGGAAATAKAEDSVEPYVADEQQLITKNDELMT